MSSDFEMELHCGELYESSLDDSMYEEISETLPTPTASKNAQFTVSRDEVSGIFKGTLDIKLPPVVVTVYKADKNEIKWGVNAAVQDVVSEIVTKALED